MLQTLPVEMGQLRKIMVLNVKGNHMLTPPIDVCDLGAEAIVFYLKHLAMGFSAWETMTLLTQHRGGKE